MRNQFRFLIVIFLIISLLAGCSTTGEQTTGRTVGTGAGAIAGAAIGAKKHGATGAIVGGVIGALAGFAVGWVIDDYQAKKTKTADQVEKQYPAPTPGSAAPAEIAAHAYNVKVIPSDKVVRGENVVIVTTFDLVVPKGVPVNVEEERTILKPDGSQLAKRRDVYNKDIDGSGSYEFSSRVSVPKGIDEGYFSVVSTLYVGTKEAGTINSSFHVVTVGNTHLIAKG